MELQSPPIEPRFIRVASDLHLEAFSPNTDLQWEKTIEKFLPLDERDRESILFLAGDICSQPARLMEFLKRIEMRFVRVFMVPGNHEYYRHDFDELNDELLGVQSNLTRTRIVTDTYAELIAGCRLIMCTMWADGGRDIGERCRVGLALNDFRLITKNNKLFTVADMMAVNREHVKFIKDELEHPVRASKTIVMTHHLPSYSLCHPRFGDECNGGFASNCDHLFNQDSSPDLWVYGHTHDTQDLMMGKTRLLCNPAGYRGEWTSPMNTFKPTFYEIR